MTTDTSVLQTLGRVRKIFTWTFIGGNFLFLPLILQRVVAPGVFNVWLYTMVALTLVLLVVHYVYETRLAKALKQAHGVICDRCEYRLNEHGPAEQRCPECGTTQNLNSLRDRWSHSKLFYLRSVRL